MARVRVRHTIGGLARDMNRIVPQVERGVAKVTRARAKEGAKVARMLAFYSANRHHPGAGHGKHYWRAITAEMLSPTSAEWGPEAAKMQGDMSFETGSRNQPAHWDIRRSGDLVAPKWFDDIGDVVDKAFW